MNSNQVIRFCAALEDKLDTHLFRQKPEDDAGTHAGTGAKVGAAVGAGIGVMQPEMARQNQAKLAVLRKETGLTAGKVIPKSPVGNVLRKGMATTAKVSRYYAKGGAVRRAVGAVHGAALPALIGAGVGAVISRKKETELSAPGPVIVFCANLEQELDTRLFRARPDDEQNSATPRTTDPMKIAAGAAGVTAVGGGALLAKGALSNYANSPAVNDRLGGLRATVPGFTQKSPGMQRAVATASTAGSQIASGVKSAAGTVAKEAAYHGRGLYNTADNAARGLLKKAKPGVKGLLARVGEIAAKIK